MAQCGSARRRQPYVSGRGLPAGRCDFSAFGPNVYLHYVLDVWFEQEVQPRLKDVPSSSRYADDFVIGFTCEEDARRVLDVLPKRFGR